METVTSVSKLKKSGHKFRYYNYIISHTIYVRRRRCILFTHLQRNVAFSDIRETLKTLRIEINVC